jgi:hypothetical protein
MEQRPVFLSHSSQDKAFVERLAHDLIMRGVRVWYSEWEIKVGDSLLQKISDGIDSSGWLLVVLSSSSIQSEWVRRELNAALILELEQRRSVFVLPARIDDAEVPLLLREKLYADFRGDYAHALEQLLRRLIPESVSSAMLSSVPELSLHYLPAVANRRRVGAFDLNRVIFAINALEPRVGLDVSDLPLYRKGQRMTFQDINRLLGPIDRVRAVLGLTQSWEHHPTKGGEMYTAAHMNELYAKLNEAIDAAFRVNAKSNPSVPPLSAETA